ncbi:CBS domain-containing protein [Rhodopirellula sp. JC639]|uniref:CBS domain-containing protein n=1 Tax=Stieleria mannarensis TaxID=2755585 RepID=UPI001601D7DB|nr:CBS domain-containing protein [Rhodopirellula sp. JC639]
MISESTSRLLVADVMKGQVKTVSSETPTGKVLEIMEKNQVHALPVVDGDKCVGIVTATDLVRLIRETNAALRSGYPHYEDCLWAVDLAHRKLDQQPVREIMSVSVETVSPGTPLCDAAKRLSTCSRHHLVVEEDGKLVGFLSSWDIAGAFC